MLESMDVVISIYYERHAYFTGGATFFHCEKKQSTWEWHKDYTPVHVEGTEKFWFYK